MSDFSYIERNLAEVREDLARIAASSGRNLPTLVCVTKSGSDEELLALVRAGATDIGENRPQELMRRGELLGDAGLYPTLHEIGNLQRNKVKYIIERASLIHSLDSPTQQTKAIRKRLKERRPFTLPQRQSVAYQS